MRSWCARRVERDVVRDERRRRVPFDDGMARVGSSQLVARVHQRLRVVIGRRRFRERRQHIQRRQPARRVLDARSLRGDARPQGVENLHLAFENSFVGADDLFLVRFESRSDESLAAGNGLLAMVVGRHVRQIRLRDLDVVAEDAVVANLQGGNAGTSPLRVLHRRDLMFPGAADVAQVVELGVDAVPNRAAIPGQCRRIVSQRRLQIYSKVGQIIELGNQAVNEGRLQL